MLGARTASSLTKEWEPWCTASVPRGLPPNGRLAVSLLMLGWVAHFCENLPAPARDYTAKGGWCLVLTGPSGVEDSVGKGRRTVINPEHTLFKSKQLGERNLRITRSSISWPQGVTLMMVEAGGIEPPSDRGQPRSPTGVVRDLVSNSGLPRTGSLRSSSPRVSASPGKQAATTQPPSCRPFGTRRRSPEGRDCYLSSQSVVIVGVLLVEPD